MTAATIRNEARAAADRLDWVNAARLTEELIAKLPRAGGLDTLDIAKAQERLAAYRYMIAA